MITANGTFIAGRILNGALAFVRPLNTIANAAAFGGMASQPQGYNNLSRALVPTLKTGGNISARMSPSSTMTADLKADGNMAAAVSGVAGFTANGNTLANGYATFSGIANMTAAATAIGNMSAAMDILARPSAFDIAQEVWNGAATGYAGTGTMGKELQDAKKAAKLAAALSA